MRIRVLTALAGLLLGVPEVTQEAAQPALQADRVLVVLKKERTLQLLSQGKVIRSYKAALGGDPIGPKAQQGDHKTPEGVYVLDSRNAHSQFYKSIHISYPSVREREAARQRGVSPGGDVFVPWFAERLRVGGIVAPAEGLDRRMHRGHKRGDGRDLAGRRGWHADRNSAVAVLTGMSLAGAHPAGVRR